MHMTNINLEVVTSPGCTHCHEFLEFWKTISGEWPNVTMRDVSIVTPEGMEMAGKYEIFAAPGIILNDEVFATGGFDKEKFIEKLKQLST